MVHEDEYMTLPEDKSHRQTRRQMSLKDKEEKGEEERRYRETMANVASYIERVQRGRAARSSSSQTSPVSTRASNDESRTSATSLLSTSDAGRLSRGGISRGCLSFRPPNTRGLADIANKNTISKDNTTGDEVREAELLTNMGKKICNKRQRAKELKAGDGEWRNRGRRVRRGLGSPRSPSIEALVAQLDANQVDELDQVPSSPTKHTARASEVDRIDFWSTFGLDKRTEEDRLRQRENLSSTPPEPAPTPPLERMDPWDFEKEFPDS